jgi:hypothetical protein
MTALNQNEIDITNGINDYMDRLRDMINDHYRQSYSSLTPPTVSFMRGKRYCRIVLSTDPRHDDRKVHSFVDMTNGNILKANGWKSPHPTPRGNVLDLDNSNFTVYGASYLK